MARKVGQIIARGDRRWLIRVYLGRDQETNKRKRLCKSCNNGWRVFRRHSSWSLIVHALEGC